MTNQKRVKNRFISKRAICVLLLLAVLISSLSFLTYAWYRNYINIKGTTISSGTLSLEIDGYRVGSSHTVTPLNDITISGSAEGSAVLDSHIMNIAGYDSKVHVYYFIKNSQLENATDIQASIALSLENTELDSSLNGISIDITEVRYGSIQNELNHLTEADIIAAISQSSQNGIPTDNDVQFINNLEKSYHEFNVAVGDYVCLRVTYEMPDSIADRQDIDLSVRVAFCLAQSGKLEGSSTSSTYNVHSAEGLRNAVAKYRPNDKIVVSGKVDFIGDLILNRPLTLEVANGELNVYGNVLMAYPYQGRYVVDTDTDGSIAVFMHTEDVTDDAGVVTGTATYGGNFTVSAPLAQVELLGKNSNDEFLGDIYVEGTFKVTASMPTVGTAYGNGLIINGANIYPVGEARGDRDGYKTITVGDHTMVNVRNYTTVGTITSVSSVIWIENRGVIGSIDLTGMALEDEYRADQPQIYINNYGELTDNNILLPEEWADKFVKNLNGSYEGNTRIVVQLSAGDLTTNTTVGFQSDGSRNPERDDIEYVVYDTYVSKVNGRGDTIVVQYTNTTGLYLVGTATDIGQSLSTLIKYYTGEIEASDEINAEAGSPVPDSLKISPLTDLKSVKIVCSGTELTAADYTYIRSMSKVQYLDLSETSSTGLKTPDSAFKNLTQLETVIPSSLDTVWGKTLFTGTSVIEITLPDSLTTVTDASTLNGVRYVHTASRYVANVLAKGNYRFTFVPYGDSVTFSAYNITDCLGYVYYDAERYSTDIGDYFLRFNENKDIKTVEYVTFNPTGSGTDRTKAFTFTFNPATHLSGEAKFDFKTITVNGTVYDIEVYSDYSFYKRAFTTGTEIELANTLRSVKGYAFGSVTGIKTLTINGDATVESNGFGTASATTLNIRDNLDIQSYGFANFKATTVNIDKNPTVGDYAFKSSTAKAVIAPNLKETGYQSFSTMTTLVKAYFPALRRTQEPIYKCEYIFMLHIGIFEEGSTIGGGTSEIDIIFIHTDETDDPKNYGSYVLEYTYVKDGTPTKNNGAIICPEDFYSIYSTYYYSETVKFGTDQDRLDELIEYYNPSDVFQEQSYTLPNLLYYMNTDGETVTIFRYLDHTPAKTTDLFKIPKNDGSGEDYEVTALSSCSYRNITITRDELVFPESMKTIGTYAFHSGLKTAYKKTIGKVNLSNVETVGNNAFRYNVITIFEGYNVTKIGNLSFSDSKETVSFIFPKLTTITTSDANGYLNAFNNCTNLKVLYMGPLDDDTIVREQLIQGCSVVEYVIIDATDREGTSTAATKFYNSYGSGTVRLPITLVMGESTWNFRNAITTDREFSNIVVSGNVNRKGTTNANTTMKVPQYMFRLHDSGVATLLRCTYTGTDTYVEVPNKVEEIEGKNEYIGFSFNKCQILDDSEEGGRKVYAFSRNAYSTAYVPDSENTVFNTGPYITSIPDYMFYGNKNLLHFEFENVTSIGASVFRDTDIKSVKADKVTTIGTYAFNESDAITELSFPKVKTIGSYAFMGMSALKTISFGRDMTSTLSDRLFVSCSNLRTIELNADKYISLSSTVFDYNTSTSTREDLITLKVRARNYGSYSSTWHSKLKAITIIENQYVEPGTGITYYYNILEGTNNVILTHLKVPTEYTGTHIVLPSSFTVSGSQYTVTELDKYLFTAIGTISTVTEITLPAGVEKLDGCLASIPARITALHAPDSNLNYSTADGVLYSKDGSYLIYYPKGKTDTSFTVPNGVKYIAEDAFNGRTHLTSVTINGQVTVMTKAFYGCTALTSVTFTSTQPSMLIGADMFTGCNANLMIYVPEESVELYRQNVILDLSAKNKITSIVTENN